MKVRIFDGEARKDALSGYGLMAYQIAVGLKGMGHEVCFFPDDKSGEDVVLWIRPPHYLKYPEFDPKKRNIIFTMHETETFEGWKHDWPQLLNKCERVITPTEWNKQVFVKNGVKVPIDVVQLGVNQKQFSGTKDYNFSIMTHHDNLGGYTSRENWFDTILAYYNAFPEEKYSDVVLTLKSYNIKQWDLDKYLLRMDTEHKFKPKITVLEATLDPIELNKLYSRHWLFVKNANREGWSLPLLEAMSAGVDVAYTDLPVLSWAEGYKNAKTFKVGDVDALTQIMRESFKKWQKQRGFINQFSWKITVKGVHDAINQT